jgi:hypothetical protein
MGFPVPRTVVQRSQNTEPDGARQETLNGLVRYTEGSPGGHSRAG